MRIVVIFLRNIRYVCRFLSTFEWILRMRYEREKLALWLISTRNHGRDIRNGSSLTSGPNELTNDAAQAGKVVFPVAQDRLVHCSYLEFGLSTALKETVSGPGCVVEGFAGPFRSRFTLRLKKGLSGLTLLLRKLSLYPHRSPKDGILSTLYSQKRAIHVSRSLRATSLSWPRSYSNLS